MSPASPEASPPPLALSLIEAGRIVFVGLGGIGTAVCRPVTRFVASRRGLRARIVLVDGDSYEERNRERMEVPELGNKAEVFCGLLSSAFGRAGLHIRPVDRFVRPDNVDELIVERDIVLAAVDNHASRKLLSERCEKLRNVVLISGGNDGIEEGKEGTYGNVQVFRRRDGRQLNATLTRFHPEIFQPEDMIPEESCEDLAAGTAPQLIFTNFFAAAVMGCAFYRVLREATTGSMYDEACFDILEAKLVPHRFDVSERA